MLVVILQHQRGFDRFSGLELLGRYCLPFLAAVIWETSFAPVRQSLKSPRPYRNVHKRPKKSIMLNEDCANAEACDAFAT